MKKYIFLVITVILIILLALLSGCSVVVTKVDPTAPTKEAAIREETKATKPVVILNERQIKILRDCDLPTDYDELNYTQKKAIVAMEEMLQYADEKYNDTFCYEGYVAKGPLEEEHMYAYPKGKSHLVFTITRTEDGFEDNYMTKAVHDDLITYLVELFEPINNGSKARLFIDHIGRVDLEKIPTDYSKFDGNISFNLTLMVDGATCTEEQIIELQNRVANTLLEHKLYGRIQFVLLEKGCYEELNSYTYTQFLGNHNYSYRERIYLSSEGIKSY